MFRVFSCYFLFCFFFFSRNQLNSLGPFFASIGPVCARRALRAHGVSSDAVVRKRGPAQSLGNRWVAAVSDGALSVNRMTGDFLPRSGGRARAQQPWIPGLVRSGPTPAESAGWERGLVQRIRPNSRRYVLVGSLCGILRRPLRRCFSKYAFGVTSTPGSRTKNPPRLPALQGDASHQQRGDFAAAGRLPGGNLPYG